MFINFIVKYFILIIFQHFILKIINLHFPNMLIVICLYFNHINLHIKVLKVYMLDTYNYILLFQYLN